MTQKSNSVTIGLQHYQWLTHQHPWLNAIECIIYNLVDPAQLLIIVIDGTDSSVCNPSSVKIWIEFALHQGWYRDTRVYKLVEINHQVRLNKLDFSLSQEAKLCLGLATKFKKNTSSLEKSNIKFHLSEIEAKLGLVLPTIFKQLYLDLGNGHFGPDYGFFKLFEENNSNKITLEQAYTEVQESNIKDWDWELPKSWLPFLYWGSDIYSLVDCSNSKIYVLDMNLKKEHNTWQSCTWLHQHSMINWLEEWLKGDVSGRQLWLEMYRIKGLV